MATLSQLKTALDTYTTNMGIEVWKDLIYKDAAGVEAVAYNLNVKIGEDDYVLNIWTDGFTLSCGPDILLDVKTTVTAMRTTIAAKRAAAIAQKLGAFVAGLNA